MTIIFLAVTMVHFRSTSGGMGKVPGEKSNKDSFRKFDKRFSTFVKIIVIYSKSTTVRWKLVEKYQAAVVREEIKFLD